MSETITIDLVTYDLKNDEFVLYLVEDSPWPTNQTDQSQRLRQIQDRVFDALDAAIDGGAAKKFPDSVGKPFRVQIDSPSGCPEDLAQLVQKIATYLLEDAEYSLAIQQSKYVKGIRVVTGHSMGRFRSTEQGFQGA